MNSRINKILSIDLVSEALFCPGLRLILAEHPGGLVQHVPEVHGGRAFHEHLAQTLNKPGPSEYVPAIIVEDE